MKLLLTLLFTFFSIISQAQVKTFRFAFISDTHIGSPNGHAEEDLRRTVRDINEMDDIAFVVITGDITELGTDEELALAKKIFDELDVPYYIIPGNHDTGWSESGGLSFTKVFGYDKFYFKYNNIHFLGCPSGPYVRMSDGHVPRDAVNWLNEKLKKIGKKDPVVFLNHYPLDNGLDNWYEVVDMLKQYNTVLALCGHGHNNRAVNAEAIPAVMGRSNLRAKEAVGGYNLVEVRVDSFLFRERNPVTKQEKLWRKVAFKKQDYKSDKKYSRPDYSINDQYKQITPVWTYSSDANVISTPAVFNNYVVFGNQNGRIQALDINTGRKKWSYKTGGPIFSSPTFSDNKMVIGSADGSIYCLNNKGKLDWKFKTGASVLGSPLIENNVVFIGGSDHNFRAIDITTGKQIWSFAGLDGPVVSKPVIHNTTIIFGAWDRNLYALDKRTGSLLWSWNNGSAVRNFSPAACIPVIKDDVVYIAAPDRFLTAININNGKTLWRTKEAAVRESIGISEDGKMVYGKTMQDTIAAFYTGKEEAKIAWKMHAGYGYEHTPSALIERNGQLFFGTKNGVVYSIDPQTQKIIWAHKIDNSMVNTLNVINEKKIIASTMDGKVVFLQAD